MGTPQSQANGLDFDENDKEDEGSDEGIEGYEFDSNNPYSNFQHEDDNERYASEYDFGSLSDGVQVADD